MENFAYLIGIIILVAFALFLLSPSLAPMESEYLELRVGGVVDAQMKAAEEADKFRTKSGIYYSISSKKPFEEDCSIEVVIKNTADLSNVLFTEKLGTKGGTLSRAANKINSEADGEFVINLMKNGRIIARKVFTVSDAVPARAAVTAPETCEVKVDAVKTAEVKIEAPKTAEVKVEVPMTAEVKTK